MLWDSALASVQATIGTQPTQQQQPEGQEDVEMDGQPAAVAALPKEVEDVLAETNTA